MQWPTVGSLAKSVDDRVVGVVTEVNWCCVRFESREGGISATARWDGLFDVQHRVVTLIYAATEPHRYECPLHAARTPEALPVFQRMVRVESPVAVAERVAAGD